MSEEEAAAARAAAYAKYNAAIIASGGLAAANFYTEKTQIELLTIAKIAALDTVAEAQATMDILNYTTQTSIIARIAAAQKLADDAKLAALKAYITEASKPITQVITTERVTIGGGGGGSAAPSPMYPSWAAAEDMFPIIPTGTRTGSIDNSVTVVVEGSVLNGDDFSDIVNRAMLDAQRRGLSQFPAGSLPG
jgi:hypothetical protein